MDFNSTSAFAIAQNEVNAHLEQQADLIAPESKLTVTQRKAKLHDKNRTRRRDVQQWVFRRTGLSSTAQVKYYLLKLGQRRDLRLTAAWIDINLNYADAIAQLVKFEIRSEEVAIATRLFASEVNNESAIADSKFKVGDRVAPIEYPATLAYLEQWSPFVIRDRDDTNAWLDYISVSIPLSNLKKVS